MSVIYDVQLNKFSTLTTIQ